MRSVVNISLPETTVKLVKKEVQAGGYASTSDFFRNLLRLWSARQLGEELRQDRKLFKAGKGKVLKSLKDLN